MSLLIRPAGDLDAIGVGAPGSTHRVRVSRHDACMTSQPRAVVFSDPNCPFCYATEERLHATGLDERVAWRGVQHASELPVPMEEAAGMLRLELPSEVAAIRRLAPDVAIEAPPGKPNTRSAIEHAAAALRRDPARGRGFVRSLYRAFWLDGTDLSDPAALAALAEQAGLPDLHADDGAAEVCDDWQTQWRRTGLGGVPLIIRDDGGVLYGLQTEPALRAFVA